MHEVSPRTIKSSQTTGGRDNLTPTRKGKRLSTHIKLALDPICDSKFSPHEVAHRKFNSLWEYIYMLNNEEKG